MEDYYERAFNYQLRWLFVIYGSGWTHTIRGKKMVPGLQISAMQRSCINWQG